MCHVSHVRHLFHPDAIVSWSGRICLHMPPQGHPIVCDLYICDGVFELGIKCVIELIDVYPERGDDRLREWCGGGSDRSARITTILPRPSTHQPNRPLRPEKHHRTATLKAFMRKRPPPAPPAPGCGKSGAAGASSSWHRRWHNCPMAIVRLGPRGLVQAMCSAMWCAMGCRE